MCHQHTDSSVKMPLLFFTLSYMNLEQVGDYHPVSATPLARPGLAAWEAGKLSSLHSHRSPSQVPSPLT